jgi:hypothetical protein
MMARAQTASDAPMQACGVTVASRFTFVWMIETLSQGSCCSRQPNIIVSLAAQQVNSLAEQVA